MLIPDEHIFTALAKAKEITETYRLLCPRGGNHSIKSVTILGQAVRGTLQGTLDIVELEMDYSQGVAARGFFLVDKESNYKIALLGGQNTCWTRLVLCKELFHVLLDAEPVRNILVSEHLDDYLYSSFPGQEAEPKKGVISEFQAEFAAMEFLFPYQDRAAIAAKPYVSAGLAEQYKIPKVMVEKYLSERYMTNMLHYT